MCYCLRQIMPVRVKICGITNVRDALAAIAAGADALGFIFYEPSPRNVPAKRVGDIIRELPPFIAKVGVFVNPSEILVRENLSCGLDTLQFHGDERPAFCRKFAPIKVFKAFRIHDRKSLQALPAYHTDAWLLDSSVPGRHGGTGVEFDWRLAIEAKKLGRPIILAGGLAPENVAAAVRQVCPYAVDVSSGVEAGPGKKDHAKLREFIAAAKRV